MNIHRFIACTSGYGRFGIGLHFAQLVEESRQAGELYGYLATRRRPGDERISMLLRPPRIRRYRKWIPYRFSPSRWYELLSGKFEKRICDLLPFGPDTFMTFAGRALRPTQCARELGYESIELVSATSHISSVLDQHQKASSLSGIDDSWVSAKTHQRILQEYDAADRIYVHSDYTRDSFVREGIDEEKLVRTHLVPNPRFVPLRRESSDNVFRVIYVGRVDSSKGVPILIRAFQGMSQDKAELVIVGGWTTRRMKSYLKKVMAADERISVRPGDPLPVLHKADVLVHPSFEDGFAYAPLEALCCGVPVIVTKDTGMKEYVDPGVNGFVVPTASVDPIIDHLNRIAKCPMEFDAKKVRSRFYPDDSLRLNR